MRIKRKPKLIPYGNNVHRESISTVATASLYSKGDIASVFPERGNEAPGNKLSLILEKIVL